jgi:16S rRNA (adenine1518-N6/adenine1519-N6)-dimethyltransferase
MTGPSPSSHTFHPRRARGQSFLRDQEILRRIVFAVDPQPGETLLEIGAGSGELTIPLAAASTARIIAIETDRLLFARLERALESSGTANVEPVYVDFLALDFQQFLDDRGLDRIRVIGNLPFSVASPILLKLLAQRQPLADLTLMFQLEVAERLIARPATKPYGFLTVVAQQAMSVSLLFRIPPTAFKPRPRVQAALVRMVPLRDKEPPIYDPAVFQALVRGLLAHRRKNISNNLKRLSSKVLDADAIREGLRKLDIDPKRRAETLSVEQFAELSHFCATTA